MAGQIDNYFWSVENVTSLCTSDCVDDTSTWVGNVGDACVGQTFSVGGKLVPVDSVALRYVEGITMACLKSEYVLPSAPVSLRTSKHSSLKVSC
jgi:hypothetical protein